jgi:hypothetical protein
MINSVVFDLSPIMPGEVWPLMGYEKNITSQWCSPVKQPE